MSQPSATLVVTEGQMLQRIRYRLQRDGSGRVLRATRAAQAVQRVALGRFFLVDTVNHKIVQDHVDLEAFSKDLGCLKPWERMK